MAVPLWSSLLYSLQKFTIMSTQEMTMTTQQIATRLAELCRMGQFEAAQKELYADDVVSIEPYETPEFAKETKGLDAIIEKGHKFESMVEEMHGGSVSEPLVAENSFAFVMSMDMTMKGKGRMNMSELCVYQVKDGKVVSEQFFM
jgi:hypothetical protein